MTSGLAYSREALAKHMAIKWDRHWTTEGRTFGRSDTDVCSEDTLTENLAGRVFESFDAARSGCVPDNCT